MGGRKCLGQSYLESAKFKAMGSLWRALPGETEVLEAYATPLV